MHAQGAAAALGQNVVIAARLGSLDDSKAESVPWDLQVFRIVAGQLKEDPAVRPALVRLARRVQEPGAVAKGRHAPVLGEASQPRPQFMSPRSKPKDHMTVLGVV